MDYKKQEELEDRIEKLINVMKVLCAVVVVALVALVIFAAVSVATSLVQNDPDTFLLVSIIMGFVLIALVLALAGILIAARVYYSKYRKLTEKTADTAKVSKKAAPSVEQNNGGKRG